MTIKRNEHQALRISGIKLRAFVQVHESVFRKILNVFCALSERRRHSVRKFLMPRWFADLFPKRVIAVVGVTCQNKYRNRIGFVEPQQNCAFKLSNRGSLLSGYSNGWTIFWFRLFAGFPAHWSIFGYIG